MCIRDSTDLDAGAQQLVDIHAMSGAPTVAIQEEHVRPLRSCKIEDVYKRQDEDGEDAVLNLGLTGHGARDAVCCQTDSDARADNTKTVTDNSHNSSLSSCAAYRRILNTIPISNAPYGIWAFGTQY